MGKKTVRQILDEIEEHDPGVIERSFELLSIAALITLEGTIRSGLEKYIDHRIKADKTIEGILKDICNAVERTIEQP